MRTFPVNSRILQYRGIVMLVMLVVIATQATAQIPPSVLQFPKGVERVEIPFFRYRDWIIVEAQVHGSKNLKLILDTGAPIVVLGDPEAAINLGIPIAGQAMVDGGDGSNAVSVPLATGIEINLGPLKIGNCMVAIGAARPAIYGVDGILGKYVFENSVVKIDWEKQILTVMDHGYFSYDGNGLKLPIFHETNGHISTDITLLGREKNKTIKATLDTGNRSNFKLDQTRNQDYYLGPSIQGVVTGWGANGPEYGELARVDMALGDHIIKGVVASAQLQALPENTDTSKIGNIGIAILERFNLILDYRNSVMYLERNKFYDKEFYFNRSGIQMQPDQTPHLKIIGIIPGSPAEEQGLITGDIIIGINGQPVESFTTEEIDDLINGKTSNHILLTIERNSSQATIELNMRKLL